MKRIINGKKYDTTTAKEVASRWSGEGFSRVDETLYRKKTGEFFLHGAGGPMTGYAETVSQNCWTGGAKIIPLTEEEARQWAEQWLDGDQYEKIFDEVEE